MDLELATTDDIIEELRKRELHFLLVAIETLGGQRDANVWIAGQGRSRQSLLRLCQMAITTFSRNPTSDDERPSDN